MALSDLPLLQADNLTVLGSFTIAGNAFAFGGHGLTFDPEGNGGAGSLWLSGTDATNVPTVGEISIPALDGVATVLTSATAIPNMTSPLNRTGGILIHNGRLIASAWGYYEVVDPNKSHWRSSDKTVANLGQGVNVGDTRNSAVYAGYMGHIPADWQVALGGPCFCGQGSISRIERGSSLGPALYAFDPDDINVVEPPVPATELMFFPESNPLHNPTTTVTPNTLYNHTQATAGAFFPPDTRSVVFLVGMGTGEQHYGTGAQWSDSFNTAQGYHAFPYEHVALAFDALDFQAVKEGTKIASTVRPYATWIIDGMGTQDFRMVSKNGLAYDPTTRRIYLANGGANINFGGTPRIWVLEHADITGEPPPEPPPVISTRGLGGTLFGPL